MRPLPLDQQTKIKAWVQAFIVGALSCFIIALFAVANAQAATLYEQTTYDAFYNPGSYQPRQRDMSMTGTAKQIKLKIKCDQDYELNNGMIVFYTTWSGWTEVGRFEVVPISMVENIVTDVYFTNIDGVNLSTANSLYLYTNNYCEVAYKASGDPSEEGYFFPAGTSSDAYFVIADTINQFTCGNATCENGENPISCPADCDLPVPEIPDPFSLITYDPGIAMDWNNLPVSDINELTACSGSYPNDGTCAYYFKGRSNIPENAVTLTATYEAEVYQGSTLLCSDTGLLGNGITVPTKGFAFSPIVVGCPEFTIDTHYTWRSRGRSAEANDWSAWSAQTFIVRADDYTPPADPNDPPDCDFWGWTATGDGLACGWTWIKYLIVPTDAIGIYFEETYYLFVSARPYSYLALPLESFAIGLENDPICPAEDITIENGNADIDISICDEWGNAATKLAGTDKFHNGVQSLLSLFVVGLILTGIFWLFWRRD